MGNRASKVDNERVETQPKLFSLLFRGMRRHRQGAISQKQLLKDDQKITVSSSSEANDNSIGSAKVAPEPSKPQGKSMEQDNHKDEKVMEVVTAAVERRALAETEDEYEEAEEYGSFSCADGSISSAGSPIKDDDYTKEGLMSDTDADDAEFVEYETATTEESVTNMKKRSSGRKNTKFRRVISKGKPVKNLLNFTACYSSCGSR
ncbi:hypothetical protein PTKIN_Ptkin05aG0206100 [Pterospermum kingtungense]